MANYEVTARVGEAQGLDFLNVDIRVPKDRLSEPNIQVIEKLCQNCPLRAKLCSGFNSYFDESAVSASINGILMPRSQVKSLLSSANCKPFLL